MSWLTQGAAATWLPVLNETEIKYGIPTNLLARVAYQECRFRPDIISGATKSPVGAVGIMQLMPQFFAGAGGDPRHDIDTAGSYLANLHARFGDWQLALAAYNWGPGHVNQCVRDDQGIDQMPTETQNYVTEICADVPVPGSLLT
jgi:soluble lytic murein transglycosylase-like protein